MIRRLVAALDAADLELDAEAIADALWLARARGAEPAADGEQRAVPPPTARTEPRPPDAEPQHPPGDVQAEGDDKGPGDGTADGVPASGPGAEASPVTLAKASALPGVLELGRALRPLKQRHPSKRRRVLDADATVQYFCDTRVLTPVTRPGAEHWFDVDVFVDAGPSMAVWHDTAAEFVSLLQRHGAFRTVRRWNLEETDGTVYLSRVPGLRYTAAQLTDPGARRLAVVLTDGVGPLWYRAPVWAAIREWGRPGTVALVSPLPARLWPGTALGVPEVRLRSHRPGTANQLLEVTLPWWWPDDQPPRTTVPVPVLTLDAAEVAAWARMTMGAGGAETAGVFAMPPGRAVARPGSEPRDAEELVRRFRVSVSPAGYRLAVCLSAVLRGRWELGMARIVQEAVFPESGQVQVAEVLIGGLVRQAERAAGQEELAFEFIPDVAAVLRRSLTGTEALRLLRDLSRYIERATGHSAGIAALLVGQDAPAAPAGAFADLTAGAANLIDTLGLTRTAASLEPARSGRPTGAERYLVAYLSPGSSAAAPAELLAQVISGAPTDPKALGAVQLPDFAVDDSGAGTDVTVVAAVPGPGAAPVHQISAHVRVPSAGASEVLNLGIPAAGDRLVLLTVFAGGTMLAELSLDLPAGAGPEVPAEAAPEIAEAKAATQSELPDAGDSDFPLLPDWPTAGLPDDITLLRVSSTMSDYHFELVSRQRLLAVETFREPAQRLVSVSRAVDPAVSRERLKATGRALWTDLIPAQIKDLFWQIRAEMTELIVWAEQIPIPWELLYPYDRGHDEGFLVEQLPVTRWITAGPSRAAPAASRITLDHVTFASAQPGLRAQAEADALRHSPGLAGIEMGLSTDISSLLSLMGSGRAGSLHISGRVTVEGRSGDVAIVIGDELLRPAQLARRGWVRASRGAGPLVFVAQVDRAREEATLNPLMADLGRQFITAGAAAFVGSAWTVSELGAAIFAQAFYEALTRGEPLGEAVYRARLATRDSVADDSWLAYMVMGNPAARVEVSPSEATGSPEASQSPAEKSGVLLSEDRGTLLAEDGSPLLDEGHGASRRAAAVARVVAVHGMGQQARGPETLRSRWLPALQDGLIAAGAGPLGSADELAVAFFGDLFRPSAVAGGSTALEDDSALDEEDPAVEEELLPLWRAAAAELGAPEPPETAAEEPPGSTSKISARSLLPTAMRVLLSSRFFSGMTERMLIGDLRQMHGYLTDPAIRHAARERLAAAMRPETRVIVAHSLGSVVAYETLCAHPEWEVPMLVTLGSPLGLSFVFDRLQPQPVNGLGSWPGSTRQWINVADNGDLMAVKRLAGLFAGPVTDLITNNGAQAHDVTTYLSSAATGRAIAAGLAD